MATFYIQLENRLLQISGDLTNENISKALGYVPVSPNMTNELSQRIDNITFDSLKDNPFLQDGSGELNIVDEAGNIIAKIDAEGIHSVDFIAGEHKLSNKTDKTYVDEAVKNVKVDLTGYATEEYVNNIEFYNIKNNPIVNNGDGKLLFVDENGYIGLQLEDDGLYVKDVIADGHTLSQKADKSDIPSLDGYATESYVNTELENYATKEDIKDIASNSTIIELSSKVSTLIGEDADKSVRDIAVDALTETLVSETATEAYDTLAEMSAWIKSHPEDAAAMNTAIQKNATDITNLDTAYKAADAKVLTDAQEYTDNINFYTIKDNPIVDNNDGNLTFVDESGNIGLQFSNNAILVNDVITPEHTLSSKADKSELPTKTSELTNDSGFITINDVPVLEIPDEYVTDDELSQKGFLVGEETSEELDDVETNTYVKYVAQTLTDEQKNQVRENIGLSEVSSINYDLNVKAINHRGYSSEAPENTIPAYIMSKQKGFTYVEGDVSFTKDNVAVLLHDATIDRTSDGSGNITSLKYQEVLQYDFGSWFSEDYKGVKIPTFIEWITLCKNLGLHPYIELKSAGGYTQEQITQIVNEVEKCGMKGKVTYISFSEKFLGWVKTADPYARLGFLTSTFNTSYINKGVALKTATNDVFMDVKLASVNESGINTCISNGLPLEVWTVNKESEILSMPAYVNGVTSDYLIAGKVLYENSLIYTPPTSNWIPTTAISLDKTSISFETFNSITLTATVEPSNSTEGVEWSSSDNAVAVVNNGVVTPLSDGSCVITAKSGDFSATCSVSINFIKYNVTSNLQNCILSNDESTILIGKSYSATITPDMGYSLKNGEITITMGDTDITNSVYVNGIINIPEVTGDIVINVSCVAVPVYNITRNLVGCSSSSELTQIGEGNPLVETFTILEGYKAEDAEISITMGGVDVTNLLIDNILTIPEVTGDIVITILYVEISYFTITRNLTNCISDNAVERVDEGGSYTERITPNSGYILRGEDITITMGGVDVTDDVYSSGVITINEVNGDIIIIAVAQADNSLVVDINTTQIVDGKLLNLGNGGSDYDMSLNTVLSGDSYSANENGVTLINHANGVVNYGFNGDSEWTITVDVKADDIGSQKYARLFRTNEDAPSVYYSSSAKDFGIKLSGKTNNGATVVNSNLVTWSTSFVNSCYTKFNPQYNDRHIYTFTCDKQTITLYIDGKKAATQNASALTSSTYVGVGDTDSSKTYYANQITVYGFRIWDRALTDIEVTAKDVL